MNTRNTIDESFVSRGLEIAERENGRWIANQAHFNGDGDLDASVRAALITATNVWVQQKKLEPEVLEAALKITTRQEARDFVDTHNPATLPSN